MLFMSNLIMKRGKHKMDDEDDESSLLQRTASDQ